MGTGLRHVSTMTCTSFDSAEGGGPDIDAHIFSANTDSTQTDPATSAEELQHTHAAVKWAAKAALVPAVLPATQAALGPGSLVAQRQVVPAFPAGSGKKDLKRANLSMSQELIFVWRSVDCDD